LNHRSRRGDDDRIEPWEDIVGSAEERGRKAATIGDAGAPLSKRERHRHKRAAKSAHNEAVSESHGRTALVLGGGAPNMALMAGALAAFEDRGVVFDVVSTSGAGALAGLLWLAPKDKSPAEALRSVAQMSIADPIYNLLPVNYKVFNKPGPMAELWRQGLAANPWMQMMAKATGVSELQTLTLDWMQLVWASLCPNGVQQSSWGLCAAPPFVESIIDFDRLKRIEPYFYLNAYNVTTEMIDDFPKATITPEHFRAALAFPFIYGPYRLNGQLYYEGAVRDCLNFKDLVEKHKGLETIVVFDVLGTDTLVRAPRDLYDSWVLSMIIPLVKTAEDNLELFALKYNKGWRRAEKARTDLLKVEFDIPEEHLGTVLDWSASNAKRLLQIGYDAGQRFCREHADKLRFRGAPERKPQADAAPA
jgi:predicted acylesterase/phospholipase RssA